MAIININLISKIELFLIIFLSFFMSFQESKAKKIPAEIINKIQTQSKIIFKSIAKDFQRGDHDCIWDYKNIGSKWFDFYNQKYIFDDTTFYSLGCIYGMYNYWSVWLKEEENGDLSPLNFAYPLYINGYVEGQVDPSQLIGITTTKLLCNPSVSESEMTIQTKCLGRGIGDYFSRGVWRYIGSKNSKDVSYGSKSDFILIYFESDLMDDGEKKPVPLFQLIKQSH